MTISEYQKLAMRTVMPNINQAEKIITACQMWPADSHIIIAALKLNSESGELSDTLVKYLCYGQEFDKDNVIEECGDILWYVALILEKLKVNMETCMQMNIDKLNKRYPDKFTEQDALERKDKI